MLIGGHNANETQAARAALENEFAGDFAESTRVAASAGDVSDPADSAAFVRKAEDVFGRLDAVVCNAGIDTIKPAIAYLPEEWDRIISVNLKGAFLIAQFAAQQWIGRNQRGGSISFTSSIAGSVGVAHLAPYAASKGGINQLVRTLALEWAEHGTRVNAVAPGYVQNIMAGVTTHADPASDERIRRFTPLCRRATVDEIAAPFVFLASPAASYVTGSILAVDGGYTSG